jgi:hypothetical protein
MSDVKKAACCGLFHGCLLTFCLFQQKERTVAMHDFPVTDDPDNGAARGVPVLDRFAQVQITFFKHSCLSGYSSCYSTH